MGASFKIDDNGLTELFRETATKLPEKYNKHIMHVAREWTKDCKQLMPQKYNNGKRPITKSWKYEKDIHLGQMVSIDIRNTAPHFGLVERGHEKWINGVDTGGFVAGKHYAERTNNSFTQRMPELIENLRDELVKELNKT